MATSTTTTRKATTRKKAPAKKAPARKAAHPLAHRVPDKAVSERYVRRAFAKDASGNGWIDLDVLKWADNSNRNVLLKGDTGAGKTTALEAYASAEGKPFITVSCNGGADPASFWGEPGKDANGKYVFNPSEIVQVIQYGGVLYLDEINFLHARIGAVFHPLTDHRRMVVVPAMGNQAIEAHPDLFIVAAYNPDYRGTRPMNEAMLNRFSIHLDYIYDRDVEREVVAPVDGMDVDPLLDMADRIRAMRAEGEISTPVSTNMLMDFLTIGADTDFEFAQYVFINHFEDDERQAIRNVLELNSDTFRDLIDETQKALYG